LPKLEYDIIVKDTGLKGLTKEINRLKNEVSIAAANFGKESEQAKILGNQLNSLKNQKAQLLKATNDLSGGVRRSTAQLQEMGENLTVIGIGIGLVIGKVMQYGKELYNLSKAGAEFGVLKENFNEVNGGIVQGTKNLDLFRTALAGNFNDKQIIEFANRMTELGYSTEQTAQIFDISERASDKFGGSIEASNTALLRFFETGKGKGLFNFGIDVGLVSDKMQELSGKTKEQIDKLSDTEKQTLRTEATLKLYGNSIQALSGKVKDNADKMRSLETALENTKLAFGETFSKETISNVESVSKGLSDLGLKMNDASKTGKSFGSALGEAFAKILPWATGGVFGVIITNLDKITGAFKALINTLKDWQPDFMNNVKIGINSFLQFVIGGVKEALSWLRMVGFIPKKEAMGGIPGTANSGMLSEDETSTKGGKTGTRTKNLKEEEKAVEELSLGYNALIDIASKLSKISPFESFGIGANSRKPAQEKIKATKAGETIIEFESLAKKITESFEAGLDIVTDIVSTLTGGVDTFISKLINGFSQVYNLANGLISFLNTIFAGSTQIFSGGLFGLLGGLLGFADGGYVSGSGSGRSDSILARVSNGEFIMNAESTRQNLPMLMAMNSGNVNNVYIGSSIDGVKFFRSTYPQYESFRNKKRL